MSNLQFTIHGLLATGLEAEAHFVEWALGPLQENNEDLLHACNGERTSINASALFQYAAFSNIGRLLSRGFLHQAGVEVKPIVHFHGEPQFIPVEIIETGGHCEVASVLAVDHPRLGNQYVRTSRVERKFDDGSFETLNTIYKPRVDVQRLPADDTEVGAV